MSMPPKEHPHRLDRRLYTGRTSCAITCCTRDRQLTFTTEETFHTVESFLLRALTKHDCEAHVYLFMPDHLHLLLEGMTDEADLWKAVVLFKQLTGYWFKQNQHQLIWQKDFFDHILRKDEDVLKQVAYLLNNPVRAGLVEDWRDYPYKGSTIYDLDTLEL